jgi:hypothetical protein
MKNYQRNSYLVLTIVVVIAAIIMWFYLDNSEPLVEVYPNKSAMHLNDEEYVISPSKNDNSKWDIIFPSGDEYVDLKPEQLAVFLKSGEIPSDTTWVIYPQCEYQLTMEDHYILIEDFGRPVAKVPYEKAGDIGKTLLKENE